MNELRTKLTACKNNIVRLKEELHKCQQAALNQAGKIQDLEIENSVLKVDVECLKQSLEWRDGVIAALRRELEESAKEAGA